MKVRELISQLEKLDPDMRVGQHDRGDFFELHPENIGVVNAYIYFAPPEGRKEIQVVTFDTVTPERYHA